MAGNRIALCARLEQVAVSAEPARALSSTGGDYWLFHGWNCRGIGLWRALAYIGGQYVWGSAVYCP